MSEIDRDPYKLYGGSNVVLTALGERFSPTKGKRQVKSVGGKKKDDSQFAEMSRPASEESPTVYEKPLQTTNQVKANLISANMIKGDMILTKPGQSRGTQKVTFVQKQVPMKTSELKNVGMKKPMMISKGKFVSQVGTKIFTTKDGKLIQLPVAQKTVGSNASVSQADATSPQQQQQQQPASQQQSILNVASPANVGLPAQQQSKAPAPAGSTPLKTKPGDIKREKRKSDTLLEQSPKMEDNLVKPAENKVLDSQYLCSLY